MTMALAGSASNLQLPTATYKLLCVSPPPPDRTPPHLSASSRMTTLCRPGGSVTCERTIQGQQEEGRTRFQSPDEGGSVTCGGAIQGQQEWR